MLKYTVAASKKIVDDLRLLAHIVTILMQSFMICYLGVAIVLNNGSRIINAVLCTLTALNFIVYLVTYGRSEKRAKTIKGAVSRSYTYIKLSLNAFSLASVIYSIYVSAAEVSGITLVIAPIMILLWVAQVLFQLAKVYAENRFNLFLDALKMDFEFVLNPLNKAKNMVHDFLGEERETYKDASEKNRRILTERAEADGLKKSARRAERIGRFVDAIKNKIASAEDSNFSEDNDDDLVTK